MRFPQIDADEDILSCKTAAPVRDSFTHIHAIHLFMFILHGRRRLSASWWRHPGAAFHHPSSQWRRLEAPTSTMTTTTTATMTSTMTTTATTASTWRGARGKARGMDIRASEDGHSRLWRWTFTPLKMDIHASEDGSYASEDGATPLKTELRLRRQNDILRRWNGDCLNQILSCSDG